MTPGYVGKRRFDGPDVSCTCTFVLFAISLSIHGHQEWCPVWKEATARLCLGTGGTRPKETNATAAAC